MDLFVCFEVSGPKVSELEAAQVQFPIAFRESLGAREEIHFILASLNDA